MWVIVAVVLGLVGARVATAAPTADEVTALPGWDKPLPTKHYSGYIPVNDSKRHMHCKS
jgi:hypothetical protein